MQTETKLHCQMRFKKIGEMKKHGEWPIAAVKK